jgi:AcrR family transcriptional regulator
MSDTRGPGTTTRKLILAVARRRLESGRELSISEIATEAGVSRQTVHRHFGGTRGLRAALVADGLEAAAGPDGSTRERLVDAAVRVLSRPEAGIVSIEAIAADAGLTKGAYYHNFVDRGEFLRAVAARVSPVDEIAAGIAATRDLPPRDGLLLIARTFYEAMRRRAPIMRNLAVNSASDPELTAAVMNEIASRGLPVMRAWVEGQTAAGRLLRVDPTLAIQALIAPVFMLIVLGPVVFDGLARAGLHPVVDNVEAYVDLILAGLEVPSASTGGEQ